MQSPLCARYLIFIYIGFLWRIFIVGLTSLQSDSPYGCVTRCSNKGFGTEYYEIAKPSWGSFCIQPNPEDTNVIFRCVKDLE